MVVVVVVVVVVVLIEEVSFDVDVGSVEVFDVDVGSVEVFDVVAGEEEDSFVGFDDEEEDSFVVDEEFFAVELEDVRLSLVDEESLFEGLKSDFDEVMERGSEAEDNDEPGRLSLSMADLG